MVFFFFKQKTAYEMRISDWSSDVCSSDLNPNLRSRRQEMQARPFPPDLVVILQERTARASYRSPRSLCRRQIVQQSSNLLPTIMQRGSEPVLITRPL